MRTNPSAHQAEHAAPYSAEGQAFRRALLAAPEPQDTPQTAARPWAGIRDARGRVVRQQQPLYLAPGYRDLIGAFVARPALSAPVVAMFHYQGQLPMTEQPEVDKPLPWSDETRGLP